MTSMSIIIAVASINTKPWSACPGGSGARTLRWQHDDKETDWEVPFGQP